MSGVVPPDHTYVVPKKAVSSMDDMAVWEKSEAYHEYVGFLLALNEAVKGKANSAEVPASPNVGKIVELLDTLDRWMDETPPIDQPQRFGNQAFRTWYKKLQQGAAEELKKAIPESLHAAVAELTPYLVEGFGNSTRIDYGSGHEMSFLMLLCCLFKVGALQETDKAAAVLSIFNRYMTLVRKLQLTYRMEPAGSHGVWSLDDYQFVPFIWGSSQLVAHPRIEPRLSIQPEIVEENHKEFLFLGCIKFVLQVKTGLFAEHSNQLWNISAVPSWSKVNAGLIKMYKAEVLAKFPVIQHVLFGSLLSLKVADIKVRGPPSRGFNMGPPAAPPKLLG